MGEKTAKQEFIEKAKRYGYSDKSAQKLAKTGDRVVNKTEYYQNLASLLIRLD